MFFSTYLGYHLLRYIPWKFQNKTINPGFIDFYKSHPYSTISSVLISIITILYLSISLTQIQVIIFILLFTFLLLYERIIFKHFSLREISYLKPFLISLIWSLSLFNLINRFHLYDFVECFLFIFFLCIPFDLKDVEEDKKEKIKTYPIRFEKRLPQTLSLLVLISSLGFYLINKELYFLIFPFLFTLILFKIAPKQKDLYYLFDALILIRLLFYFFQY